MRLAHMANAVTLLSLLAVAPVGAEPITQQDREALIRDLERSREAFLAAIADVTTEAQWDHGLSLVRLSRYPPGR